VFVDCGEQIGHKRQRSALHGVKLSVTLTITDNKDENEEKTWLSRAP